MATVWRSKHHNSSNVILRQSRLASEVHQHAIQDLLADGFLTTRRIILFSTMSLWCWCFSCSVLMRSPGLLLFPGSTKVRRAGSRELRIRLANAEFLAWIGWQNYWYFQWMMCLNWRRWPVFDLWHSPSQSSLTPQSWVWFSLGWLHKKLISVIL